MSCLKNRVCLVQDIPAAHFSKPFDRHSFSAKIFPKSEGTKRIGRGRPGLQGLTKVYGIRLTQVLLWRLTWQFSRRKKKKGAKAVKRRKR